MRERYTNLSQRDVHRSFWDFFCWKIGLYNDPVLRQSPPIDFAYPAPPLPFDEDLPSAAWMGHSTFLIAIKGFSILTDPIWDTHCAPIRLPVFKRLHEPPIALSDLPPIDLALISHNHYDHLDAKTVRHLHAFHPEVQLVVPLGLSKWFKRRGVERVRELGWWESVEMPCGKITAVPSQHFSGRGLWDRNKSHWNGYVLETTSPHKRFYFTGDTGYNGSDFKKIGSYFPHMDLSLIPIGTYVPQEFMQPVHCSPWEAVQIHRD